MCLIMITLPGTTMQLRVFERVDTKDSQYDIFDFGVQHADGRIDSLVVGGSFATLKEAVGKADKKAAKKRAKAEAKAAAKKARKMTPVVENSSNGVTPSAEELEVATI